MLFERIIVVCKRFSTFSTSGEGEVAERELSQIKLITILTSSSAGLSNIFPSTSKTENSPL